MADCHKHFIRFDHALAVGDVKNTLKGLRGDIKNRLESYFWKHHGVHPLIKTIGSFALGSMVSNKSQNYDLDIAIFLPQRTYRDGNQEKSIRTLVHAQVKKIPGVQVSDHNTCISARYQNGHTVDIPVFYLPELNRNKAARLITLSGEVEGNPLKYDEWFQGKKGSDGQLIRCIRYFKAWAGYRSQPIRSGIALVTMFAKNFQHTPNHDDQAMARTITALHNSLSSNWKLILPGSNNEDLLTDYDKNKQTKFLNALRSFADDAQAAVNAPDERAAVNLWQQQGVLIVNG